MIIDEKSVFMFGNVPESVLYHAKIADTHGKSFSQWNSSLYVYYNTELSGWIIVDNLNRGIYNSIFYCTNSKTFFMYNTKNLLLHEYKTQDCSRLHAMQYFLAGITENLINEKPSERNLV